MRSLPMRPMPLAGLLLALAWSACVGSEPDSPGAVPAGGEHRGPCLEGGRCIEGQPFVIRACVSP